MKTDTEMKNSYLAALREAQRELAGIDGRRRALQATIAGLSSLIQEDDQLSLGGDVVAHSNGSEAPAIPPNLFKGKQITQAYREFVLLHGEGYRVPQVRDALLAGGVETKVGGNLLAALHSVVRRERLKKEKEAAATGA